MRTFIILLAMLISITGTVSYSSSARAANCGAQNQRACNVWERVPSCNSSLIESRGRCISRTAPAPRPALAPANCGAENQRPCNLWERIPSCNGGMSEIRGNCLRQGACGANGQRPCEVGERVPSCNGGLKENFKRNVCEGLRPGETPFLGGLSSLSEFYGSTITSVCQQGLGTIRIDTSTSIGVGAECTKNVFIGAACNYLADALGAGVASSIGGIADTPRQIADAQRQAQLFGQKVNSMYQSGACQQFAEKTTQATYHGRANFFRCGGGQFADPNGNCYSCPGGYTRTLEPVTSAKACVDKPAGELLRSACAVFQAATQDMQKSASCMKDVLTSGVFMDSKIRFDNASKEFCLAGGELTYAITGIIVPGKSPDQKTKQLSGSIGKFVQKIKTTKQRFDPALNALSNAKTVVEQGSNMTSKFAGLVNCQ